MSIPYEQLPVSDEDTTLPPAYSDVPPQEPPQNYDQNFDSLEALQQVPATPYIINMVQQPILHPSQQRIVFVHHSPVIVQERCCCLCCRRCLSFVCCFILVIVILGTIAGFADE
ncbi:hypothetical protein TSAR_008916 [Trichomalopsis sarcophagae]|uniref:Uncharacterized protein n=1 Tax=Trichomalopsis sarcophagae TaxID=543379 RepID=A0A232F104_9HYME|nr:hypothetical protein TSAR_008916 [Trichomalopsis sarcophagae]